MSPAFVVVRDRRTTKIVIPELPASTPLRSGATILIAGSKTWQRLRVLFTIEQQSEQEADDGEAAKRQRTH